MPDARAECGGAVEHLRAVTQGQRRAADHEARYGPQAVHRRGGGDRLGAQ